MRSRAPKANRGPRYLSSALALLIGAGVMAHVQPAAAADVTVSPAADSRVLSASPTVNSGTLTRLDVDSPGEQSYLRFDVTGVTDTVQTATLRLFVRNGSSNAPSIYFTDNTWTETGITWNNKPPATSAALANVATATTGTWSEYDLTGHINGNGTYDFVLLPDSTDGIQYDSREGTSPPQLVLNGGGGGPTNAPPVAGDDTATTPADTPVTINVAGNDQDPNGNLNPATATTTCTGCATPTNGTLTNNANGSFTYTPATGYTGPDSFAYQICDTLNACDTATVTITVTPQDPTPTDVALYVSSSSGSDLKPLPNPTITASFKDEDIIEYNLDTGAWTMTFDGSDLGLSGNLDDFHVLPNGDLLLSWTGDVTLPITGAAGLTTIRETDIVRFSPASLGQNTAGSFSWFLDGSDVGLEPTGEDVDAIGFTPLEDGGRLVVSTTGSFGVPGASGTTVSGKDEDLIVFNDCGLGEVTCGYWEMYLDGSDVGLGDSGEDVNGVAVASNGDIHLTNHGGFSVPGLSGDANDIFVCVAPQTGPETRCPSYTTAWGWAQSANWFPSTHDIDGFDFVAP